MATQKERPGRLSENLPAVQPSVLRNMNPYNMSREQRDAFREFTQTFHTEIARGKIDRLDQLVQEISAQRKTIQQKSKLAIQKDLKRIEQLYRRAETFRRFGLEPEKLLKGRVTFQGPKTKGHAAPTYQSMIDTGSQLPSMPSIRGRGRPSKADQYDSIFSQSPDGFLTIRDVDDAEHELGRYDDEMDDVTQDLSKADRLLSATSDVRGRAVARGVRLSQQPRLDRGALKQLPAYTPHGNAQTEPPIRHVGPGTSRKLLTAGERG